MGLLPVALGDAVRASVLPARQGLRQRGGQDAQVSRAERHRGAQPAATVASQRIADHVREQILSGALKPGHPDPPGRPGRGAGRQPAAGPRGAAHPAVGRPGHAAVQQGRLGHPARPARLRAQLPDPGAARAAAAAREHAGHHRRRPGRARRPAGADRGHRPTSRSSWCWTAPCTGRRTGTTRPASWSPSSAGSGTPPSTTAARSPTWRASHATWIINAEHRLLIQALRDGDGDEAERILELHIRRTRVELRAHPEVFDTVLAP